MSRRSEGRDGEPLSTGPAAALIFHEALVLRIERLMEGFYVILLQNLVLYALTTLLDELLAFLSLDREWRRMLNEVIVT